MIRTLLMAAMTAAVLIAQPARAQYARETFVVAMPGDAATLDPHLHWDTDSYMVYRNVFDNLVTRDPEGRIVPQVATGWRYLDDRTIEFDLRMNIRFHDGSPLTVDDVVFSIRRVTDPALKSPQLSQFDQIDTVEAVGQAKMRMKTKSTYPALMAQLVKMSIVPKAHVEKVGDQKFNLEPMGSGPYRFKSWQKGIGITLEANDTYWGGRPPFRTLAFRLVPDLSTRVADLKTGKADLARGLTPDQAQQVKADRNLQVLSGPTERIGYLFINAMQPPTDDRRVRQALAYAIDRKTIIEALLQGYANPVEVMLTPASTGYVDDVKGYPFDPVRARALIKEAGAEGKTLTFLTSPVYDARIVQAIQQMLSDVGLKVEIQTMDQPTFLRRRQGRPDEAGNLSLGRWSCACQDADGVIFPMFRSGSPWSKYANPAFDAEVDAARVIIDESRRKTHYRRAFEILNEDMASLPLYQDYAIYAARRELRWKPTPAEALTVMNMQWVP